MKTIEVTAVNPKTGRILAADGTFYNLSKYNTELSPSKFKTGEFYDVEIKASKTGGLYITALGNAGKGTAQLTVNSAAPKAAAQVAAKSWGRRPFKPAAKDSGMSKEDWAAKDRAQMIGGLMHDVQGHFGPLLAKSAETSETSLSEIATLAVDLVLFERELLIKKLEGK